jgi:hypothetical protein
MGIPNFKIKRKKLATDVLPLLFYCNSYIFLFLLLFLNNYLHCIFRHARMIERRLLELIGGAGGVEPHGARGPDDGGRHREAKAPEPAQRLRHRRLRVRAHSPSCTSSHSLHTLNAHALRLSVQLSHSVTSSFCLHCDSH